MILAKSGHWWPPSIMFKYRINLILVFILLYLTVFIDSWRNGVKSGKSVCTFFNLLWASKALKTAHFFTKKCDMPTHCKHMLWKNTFENTFLQQLLQKPKEYIWFHRPVAQEQTLYGSSRCRWPLKIACRSYRVVSRFIAEQIMCSTRSQQCIALHDFFTLLS